METVAAEHKSALVINSADNVAVALADLRTGDVCSVRFGEDITLVEVKEDISFGHKIALQTIKENEKVLKYGEEIGRMNQTVEKGGWIHNHNMYCERGKK